MRGQNSNVARQMPHNFGWKPKLKVFEIHFPNGKHSKCDEIFI